MSPNSRRPAPTISGSGPAATGHPHQSQAAHLVAAVFLAGIALWPLRLEAAVLAECVCAAGGERREQAGHRPAV